MPQTFVVYKRLMADFALASHRVHFFLVDFETSCRGEDFSTFDVIADKLMIL